MHALRTGVAAILLSVPSACHSSGGFQVEEILRISVDSSGAEGNAPSSAFFALNNGPALSADGRFAAFQSEASNLVAGDTNGFQDVFVRDVLLGTTRRVSVATDGTQASDVSLRPAISGDGRIVIFQSAAANLVAGDANGVSDIFAHDLATGVTVRVSVSSTGTEGNGSSTNNSISEDGRFVAFASFSTNLVVPATNGFSQIFVRDLATDTTFLASVGAGGMNGDFGSDRPTMSSDGRFVAFDSTATDLVAGDTNAASDIFVRDTVAGTTSRVSLTASGLEATGGMSQKPAISGDGRYVAFTSQANNLVAEDADTNRDVYVRDTVAGTTDLISVPATGPKQAADSRYVTLSRDGRVAAFQSLATNLADADPNALEDVFVRDLQSGVTSRIAGGNGASGTPAVSRDGASVAFQSSASDLVTGDSNAVSDIFVWRRRAVNARGTVVVFSD